MCNAIKENLDTNSDSEPEIKEFNYDVYFKDKKLKLPKCQHERPLQEVTQYGRIKDKEGNLSDLPIEKHEYNTCHECGGELVALDRSRGEKVCDQCGMTNKHVKMTNDYILQKQCSPEKLNDSKTTEYTPTEKKFLKSKKRKGLKTRTSKADWRKAQHVLTLQTITKQLFMTKPQIDQVKSILDDHSLKIIHSRVDRKITIAGICRYILLKDGRGRGNELRFNISAFKFIGLDNSNYHVIEHNLKRLGI